MDLKKQIGQLMVIGFHGLNPSDDVLRFVEEWGVGGVIFFVRNIGDPNDLPAVVARFEKAAGQPMFTSIDQEGGLVLRVLKTGSLFPGAMGLAATGDTTLVKNISKAMGLEMRSLGLNWNLAPVLDINHPDNPGIGARSFGDTPEKVAKYGVAAIEGFREGGILACAKHFPGKGHAMVDSHLSLPTIPYDAKRLHAFELYPFAKAIEAGIDAVMTSHVYFPAFESTPGLPGTLSKPVLTDLLRKTMGFKGLLITDDMEMGAITETFGVPEASRLSFLAGSDLLLICHDLERQRQAAEAVLKEVQTSAAGKARLEESLTRISAARAIIAKKPSEKSLPQLAKIHEPLIIEAYEKSIVFSRLEANRLPLKPEKPLTVICPEVSALVQVEETQQGEGLAKLIQHRLPEARCLTYNPKAASKEILAQINTAFSGKKFEGELLVLTYNAHLFAGQKEAFNALTQTYPSLILVALRNPYDMAAIPGPKTAATTFGFRSPAVSALLDVLTGLKPPKTTGMPVALVASPENT